MTVLLSVLTPAVAGPPAHSPASGVRVRHGTGAAIEHDPLKVVIDRLAPSVVPAHGDVTVSGRIRNRSGQTWTDLTVYLLTSAEPMTTTAALEAAVDGDPHEQVGNRIVEPGLYRRVSDLAPRQTTRFLLSVPRSQLGISGDPGVYWLGVQVLGTSDEGRIDGADGRARTFLPLVPPSNPGTRLALGMQLRAHVVRSADGRLAQPDEWASMVSGPGRLERLLDLSESSDYPLTWVVDPAVVQAVRSLAAGNPPLQLGAEGGAQGGAQGGKDGEAVRGAAGGASATPGGTSPEPGTAEASAADWLAQFAAGTANRPVLTLPYGDLDVSAAVDVGLPDLVSSAISTSRRFFADSSVDSSPVVVPNDGYLAPQALAVLPRSVGLVLGSGALEAAGGPGPLVRAGGGRVLVAPTNHDVQGPHPGDERLALAVRQRLLADAALHALSNARDEPLVLLLPTGWNPGDAWRRSAFFRGLDVPWLTGVRITDVLDGPAPRRPRVRPGELDYPAEFAASELPAETLQSSASLIAGSSTLSQVLGEAPASGATGRVTGGASASGATAGSTGGSATRGTATVGEAIERQALEISSVWSRFFPGVAAARGRAAQAKVGAWLGRITVRGPSFVLVSSETGTFQVTLVNGLDQPVTVGLRPTVVGGGLRVSAPGPVRLPPHGRGAMRIQVTARGIGVHEVTLQPVTASGTALGRPDTFTVRSSRVGAILWLVMAVGAVLLFGTIAFRVARRIRQRRRTHGPLLKQGAT